MTDQTDNTKDAREASMSRVTTQETILADLKPQTPATEAEGETPSKEKQEEQSKPKKGAQQRIREVIEQRNKAEHEAEKAKSEAAELRARLEAFSAQAPTMQDPEKPNRSQFANDEEYIEALADYKAKQVLVAREREQQQARFDAEMRELTENWNRRQEAAIKEIPDYKEVVGAAEIQIAPHVHQFLVESEEGPHLAYFLALNQDEVKKLNAMRPATAARYLVKLEDELREVPDEKAEVAQKIPKSKAPEPITPVKGNPSANPGPAESFEEYKRRREAQKRK